MPVYILLLIVFQPTSASAAGELITPSIIGALVAGWLAKSSKKEWHDWTYLVAVAGVVAIQVVLVAFSPGA